MFPLQILAVFSSLFLIYFLVCWLIFFDLESGNCYDGPFSVRENSTCEHRQQSCGDSGINVSYPFRFQDDPIFCSSPEFNLSCQHNRAVLYLNPDEYPKELFYVQSIDYENKTIRVIDPGVQKDNCSTLPLHSLPPFSGIFYQVFTRINQFDVSLLLIQGSDTNNLVFVSCKSPVTSESKLKFHRLVDTASCNFSQVSKTDHESSPYNYVLAGGNVLVSDLEESCTINRIVPAQIDESPFKGTVDNVSFQVVHDLLADGFQLNFTVDYGQLQPILKKSFRCFFISILNNLRKINTSILQSSSKIGRMVAKVVKCLALVITARNVVGILSMLAFLIYKWRRRHSSVYDLIEEFLQANNGLMPIRYSYKEIKSMTNNFREKLGEGGFGVVYKGKLRSGSLVAVKMLTKPKANEQDFINEVATIGRIHHVNVVRLVGFCVTPSKRILVYDYMPNGSLDKFIFSGNQDAGSLTWKKAYEIAIGVARGIAYLHQGCNMQILHFDIKPQNILLDDNFIPKISDFGLARLYPVQDNYVATLTAIRGTIGYIAPELIYKNIGRVSYKADVYSFGMLLMDMAGRWRNVNVDDGHSSQMYFTTWIYNKFDQIQNTEIGDHFPDEEHGIAKKLILVALWCIQMTPTERPSMREVIEMLEGNLEELQLPPKTSLSLPD